MKDGLPWGGWGLGRSGGIGASVDAGTRGDFRLWRSAVGGAPRQQFVSCALSPRRKGAGGEEGAERGRGDKTGRPTGSRARKGRSRDSGPHLELPRGGEEGTETPGPGPACTRTPVLGR